ncbi:MDN1 protein, partial [Polyodon spathula]|nr:MDN1 protein [Polyodon spathula]
MDSAGPQCILNTLAHLLLDREYTLLIGRHLRPIVLDLMERNADIIKADGRINHDLHERRVWLEKLTFAVTCLSSVLLEQLAVCVNKGEPVLLVGETGTEKSATVQYLASITDSLSDCVFYLILTTLLKEQWEAFSLRLSLAQQQIKLTETALVFAFVESHRRGLTVFAGKHGFISLRDLFRWAKRCWLAEENQKDLDWLQHLANDGFMLLAGRVSYPEEAAILGVLEKHFKKKLNPGTLFSQDNVSKQLFE